jgi:hypothetical protein
MDSETIETIIRYTLIGGLAVAIWSFNRSMERNADALTKIANLKEASASDGK